MANVYPDSVVISAKISGTWTNISSKVVSDLDGESGMHDGSYSNRLAAPGRLTFELNNESGTYTPSSTFRKGVEIKVEVTYAGVTKTKFYGRIEELTPDVGTFGNQRVKVLAMDWLQFATDQVVREQPVATNRPIREAVTELLGTAPIQPLTMLLDSGVQMFPTVFDSITKNTKIYQELNNLIMSEWSYGYMDQGGERLRIESNDARKNAQLAKLPLASDGSDLLKSDGDHLLKSDGGKILLNRTSQASYNNTFDDLDVIHGRHLLNDVAFTVYPRIVDTTLKVLFTLGEPILVPTSTTIEVTAYFRDPIGGNPISATNLQTPVITTDYLMFQFEDGTGTNHSANFIITPRYSSEGATYEITNQGDPAYITFLQQRGYGIYSYNSIDILAEDTISQELFGPKSLAIRQPYQQNTDIAIIETKKIVDIEKDPRTVVLKAYFTANASDEKMKTFMHVDIGSLVGIECTKPPIDSDYFANGLKWKITQGGMIKFALVLKDSGNLTPIAVRFSGISVSRNAILYGVQPKIATLNQMSLSVWVYLTAASTNYPIMSNYGIDGWYWFVLSSGKMRFRQNFTPTDGIWDTTSDVFTAILNGWHQIGITYDSSSAANDPVFYIDGVSVSVTESSTPAGAADRAITSQFILANMKITGDVLGYNFKGLEKDARVYNRILSATEMAEIEATENDYSTVSDGLIFQGLFVRNSRFADYVDDPILPNMKVMDKLSELPGEVTYDTSNTTFQVKGADPELTTYP